MRRKLAAACIALALALLPRPAHADRAAAEKALMEGVEFEKRQIYKEAAKCYTRAIEADPTWTMAYHMRAMARRYNGQMLNESLNDFNYVIAAETASRSEDPAMLLEAVQQRIRVLISLERYEEAVQAAEDLLKKNPNDADSIAFRADARAYMGDVDGAIEDADRSLKLGPAALQLYPEFRELQGDWTAMEADSRKVKEMGPEVGMPGWLYRSFALVELGKADEAEAAVKECEQKFPSALMPQWARAYLMATPSMGKAFDSEGALKILDKLEAETGPLPNSTAYRARALFLTGRFEDCVASLRTRFKAKNFQTQFWLGVALWKLERFAEARPALADARRLNSYFMAHAKRIPGLEAFAATIDAEIAAELKGGGARGSLGYEMATHLLTVAEIETLVRRYRFSQAASEYERLLTTLASPVRKAEVENRIKELKGMSGALDALVKSVNDGKAKLTVKVGKQDLKISKSDDRAFEFSFEKGEGKFPWAYLDPLEFFRMANPQAQSPEQRFGLGVLLWDVGDEDDAQKNLDAPSKASPALRGSLDNLVARKRGIETPKGGFLLYKGKYVTPEEKTNLEKGLVRFQREWVTPADREKLAKGLIKVSDKWVSNDEKKLLDAGFRKWKGQWMDGDDYLALRSKWENAWDSETEHYKIRTNESEEFATTLAVLIEAAYADYKEFYQGREPKLGKEKMMLYAFRTYEDYRKYCVDNKAEAQLNAGGFASSDSNVVVGWNKTGNRGLFYQTMVHEAAHLFFFRVAAPKQLPSWHAEAMATWFEGFQYDGKAWVFNHVSESRLAFAREAMKAGKQLPLKDLLAGDALALINNDSTKAILFYSECWSLNYFLNQTANTAYRKAYLDYRKSVEGGSPDPLLKFFADPVALEKDWVQFISSM